MGADMMIEMFPAFRLNNERRARIMASLNHKTAAEWDKEPEELEADLQRLCAVATGTDFTREALYITEFDHKGAPMKVVVTGGMSWGDPPTELFREIADFHFLCTDQSIALMDSYAKADYQRRKKTRLPVQRRAKKSQKKMCVSDE